MNMVKVRKDLTGQKFNRLTVIKQIEDYVDKNGKHYAQWLCECDCANKAKLTVRGCNLISGNTTSCGCLRKEISSINNKKYNSYNLSNEYGIGYTTKNEEFYFDLEDYEKIKDYCWYIDVNGYVMTDIRTSKNRKAIGMHRLVTDCPSDLIPDHIHGNKTRHDNRKSNLRIVTRNQNNMNKIKQSNNTSGITGVYWNDNWKKWIAQIVVNKQNFQKGFNSFEDAVSQRKEWEEKYFGEFSYDNSMRDING